MTTYPKNLKIKFNDKITKFKLTDDNYYMRHIENDDYYILVIDSYHDGHRESEIFTTADEIINEIEYEDGQVLNSGMLDEDSSFCRLKINKKFFDEDIEQIISTDFCEGTSIPGVQFNLKKYAELYNKDLYNLLDKSLDMKRYGKILVWN